MNIEQFTEYKWGKLVPISDRGRADWAFVPSLLPVAIHLNEALWSLLADATRLIERLAGVGSALPGPALLLRPLQRRESLTSNSIEGTFVAPKELLLFEVDLAQAPARSADQPTVADWHEVRNYDRALQAGSNALRENQPLDRSLLCGLHETLLQGVRGRDKSPGRFRDSQVYVGVDRRYVPPPPSELDALLQNWESYVLDAGIPVQPLIRAFVAHYQFEAIHPFKDGNGRLGRLWLSLTIQKWLAHDHAWLYLSEFFERHRKDYIERLFRISTHGEWAEWIEFCLVGAREQAESSIRRCSQLVVLRDRYLQRIESPRAAQIVELLFDNPYVDMPTIVRKFKVTAPTARSDVDRLMKASILEETAGKRRPMMFIAREIFETAYAEDDG